MFNLISSIVTCLFVYFIYCLHCVIKCILILSYVNFPKSWLCTCYNTLFYFFLIFYITLNGTMSKWQRRVPVDSSDILSFTRLAVCRNWLQVWSYLDNYVLQQEWKCNRCIFRNVSRTVIFLVSCQMFSHRHHYGRNVSCILWQCWCKHLALWSAV